MSLCIIIADADKKRDDRLRLMQIVESLVYNREKKSVSISFDVLVGNQRGEEVSLFLVHRGLSPCVLQRDNLLSYERQSPDQWRDEDAVPREAVLRAVYQDDKQIIDPVKGRATTPKFHERRDSFGLQNAPTTIDCMEQSGLSISTEILAKEDDWPEGIFPPFSAFRVGPLRPGNSWFRIVMEMTGLSYDYLVDYPVHFWVDGPHRVQQQILEKDIPLRGHMMPECEAFFKTHIADFVLEPIAYDVVIHLPGTDGVSGRIVAEPCSGDEYVASITHPAVSKRAVRFVTRSPEFWIDLRYADDTRLKKDSVAERLATDAIL